MSGALCSFAIKIYTHKQDCLPKLERVKQRLLSPALSVTALRTRLSEQLFVPIVCFLFPPFLISLPERDGRNIYFTGKHMWKLKFGGIPLNNINSFPIYRLPPHEIHIMATKDNWYKLRKCITIPNSCPSWLLFVTDANIANSGFYCNIYYWWYLHLQYTGRREWEREKKLFLEQCY